MPLTKEQKKALKRKYKRESDSMQGTGNQNGSFSEEESEGFGFTTCFLIACIVVGVLYFHDNKNKDVPPPPPTQVSQKNTITPKDKQISKTENTKANIQGNDKINIRMSSNDLRVELEILSFDKKKTQLSRSIMGIYEKHINNNDNPTVELLKSEIDAIKIKSGIPIDKCLNPFDGTWTDMFYDSSAFKLDTNLNNMYRDPNGYIHTLMRYEENGFFTMSEMKINLKTSEWQGVCKDVYIISTGEVASHHEENNDNRWENLPIEYAKSRILSYLSYLDQNYSKIPTH